MAIHVLLTSLVVFHPFISIYACVCVSSLRRGPASVCLCILRDFHSHLHVWPSHIYFSAPSFLSSITVTVINIVVLLQFLIRG